MENWFIIVNIKWLLEHAHKEGEGSPRYLCNESGAVITMHEIGRSIHIREFGDAGFGEVRMIQHLRCSHCMPSDALPTHGFPIFEDEITNSPGEILAQVNSVVAIAQDKQGLLGWFMSLMRLVKIW